MAGIKLQTESLTLTGQSPAEALAMVDAMSPADRAQVSPDWLARVRSLMGSDPIGSDPWTLGFTIIHRATGAAIGNCGFTGPPDADGVVEIAYAIDPDHRGRGYATEAAAALVECALADASVRVVCAHTLPEPNASTRVLTRCGFRCLGEVTHPEDGLVWRWELRRDDVRTGVRQYQA